MCESVVACVDTRLGAPWCGPPPRKVEQPLFRGGMVQVRWNRRESSVGLGLDRVQGCCYGMTYHDQVEDSTGQSPSDESQRARSTGQLGFGVAFGV